MRPTFKPRETWIHVAFTSSGIKKFGLELPPSHNAYGFNNLPKDVTILCNRGTKRSKRSSKPADDPEISLIRW